MQWTRRLCVRLISCLSGGAPLTSTVDMPIAMQQCLKCKSQRVTRGRVVNYDSETSATFRPLGLRFLALTLKQGPELAEDAFSCLDCGLVGSAVSPEKLDRFIRKHCEGGSDNASA